ncbi:hypothetical protein Adt_17475 [Abeliophyllum distichum]|uniref:Uncharacterized protein n=1 Tax=Abeliophyllum distichum TaxID=126358 RepID=A0ABD1TGK0_9LAMI
MGLGYGTRDRNQYFPRIEGPLLQFTREDRTSPSSFRGGHVLQISIFDSFVNLLDPPSHGMAYGYFPMFGNHQESLYWPENRSSRLRGGAVREKKREKKRGSSAAVPAGWRRLFDFVKVTVAVEI